MDDDDDDDDDIYILLIQNIALCYKPAGRRFNSRWCHGNFSMTSLRLHYGPRFNSASNRNEYQVYFLGVKAAGA